MRIPTKSIEFEIEQKRSRFIAHLIPMQEEAQLKALQSRLRLQHPKASHICYGYRLINASRQISEGFSDDGEPSGTSGPPILKVLQHKEMINCGVLVVRYFGGIKLGTGGLQRAYSQSASDALSQLGGTDIETWEAALMVKVSGRFETESELRRELATLNGVISNETYTGEGFKLTVQLTEPNYKQLKKTVLARHLTIKTIEDNTL